MPANKKNKINLLPQEEFETSTFGRILKWALSSFRVMVIVTELVVMGAFLSRFWLDAKNSDLNDDLNTSKAQVSAYSDIESTTRSNQKRLAIAKSLYTQKNVSEIIENISKLIPSDISLNSISISESVLTLKASSLSERSIMQFLVNLDNNEDLTDVNLSQISSGVDNSYITIFTITANVKSFTIQKGTK
jgi:Tfp pilus assembly protein PilN